VLRRERWESGECRRLVVKERADEAEVCAHNSSEANEEEEQGGVCEVEERLLLLPPALPDATLTAEDICCGSDSKT
jgi:hypothetical protein